jgi:glycosyltransferase involved in cell wall biosynthesis
MPQAKVSVIIPAFNRARYIRQTVESVLNQSYSNIETIVVDDGSTDDTLSVLEEFTGKIRLLVHPGRQNRGQSASINLGLEQSDGDYVAILDSDDYWEPEKIAAQVGYLDQNPETGLVYCNGTAVNSNGGFLYNIYKSTHKEESRPERVLLDCYIHLPSNSMLRKSVLDLAGRFDESLRAAQDHDMLIRVAEITRLGYINRSLYHYRRHQDSISKSNQGAIRRWHNGFNILNQARNRYPYPRAVINKRKAALHFRLFQCAVENKSLLNGLPHLLLAGLYDPLRACSVLLGRERITSPH